MIADVDKSLAREFGVLLENGIALRYAISLIYCSGLFIIDPSNRIRQATINDLPIGRSVDEALRLVKAIQYTDKHGEGREKAYI